VLEKFFHPLAASPLKHGTAGACGLAPMEKFHPEQPFGPASCTGGKNLHFKKKSSHGEMELTVFVYLSLRSPRETKFPWAPRISDSRAYTVTGSEIGHFPKENDRRSHGWLGFLKCIL